MTAGGRGSFRGYAMSGVADRGRFVLEAHDRGSGTLVGDGTWDEFSRLGTGQLLRDGARERPSVPNRT